MVCRTRRCTCRDKKIKVKEFKIRYTQKQIDKYQRQKYIGELEKIGKNLFRMFRNEGLSASDFIDKFKQLKEKLDLMESIPLDLEYYKELEKYINRLYVQVILGEVLNDSTLSDIRDVEMSNLNRLQKLKNSYSYKKEKHKSKIESEDWG